MVQLASKSSSNQNSKTLNEPWKRKISFSEKKPSKIKEVSNGQTDFLPKPWEYERTYDTATADNILEAFSDTTDFFSFTGPSPPVLITAVNEPASERAPDKVPEKVYQDISFNTPLKKSAPLSNVSEAITDSSEPTDHLKTTVDQDAEKAEKLQMLNEDADAENPKDQNDAEAGRNEGQDTPVKKNSRKRIRNPSCWEKNVRKKNRNEGKEYINTKGETVSEKKVQKVDCRKCYFKCDQKFNLEERQLIFQSYWETSSFERQRDFINQNVHRVKVQNRKKKKIMMKPLTGDLLAENGTPRPPEEKDETENCRRRNTYQYFLPKDNVLIRTCKKFFLATLDIKEKPVFNSKNNENELSGIAKRDGRGRHPSHRKTSDEALEIIRNHINSFPQMESHYCRQNSKKKYLDSNLNLKKMFDLYLEFCEEKKKVPVKIHVYREVFNKEFNLGFHKPKKDSCLTCEKYRNMEVEKKELYQEEFNRHQENKNLARQAKQADKEKAMEDASLKCFTMDLQAVLYSPCSNVSNFYYSRKMATYNFTIYDQVTSHGECFLWDETDGKRGSDEIGSALYKHLLSLPNHVKHVIYYSDCCGGQNRNRYVTTLLLHAIRNISNLEKIEIKFLESGHTQMECDSMHSTIEKAKKNLKIFSPAEYETIIKAARKKQPYEVIRLNFTDFYDLKLLKEKTIIGQMAAVSWLKIKHIFFEKKNPNTIFLKTSHRPADEPVKMEAISPRSKDRKKKTNGSPELLVQKYKAKLPISVAKKKDLLSLCKSEAIPHQFHSFYENLLADTKTRDCLPEPDEEEDEDE